MRAVEIVHREDDERAGRQRDGSHRRRGARLLHKNPDRFKRAETVRASHILLLIDPKADEATKKQATAKIAAVLKRAKSGEDFAALAQQNSQDGSAQQGGDLGYFPKEKMVQEFADVAFAPEDRRDQRRRDDAVRRAHHQGDRPQARRNRAAR